MWLYCISCIFELSWNSHEFDIVYFSFLPQAALALYDGDAEITGEGIKQLLAATGNEVSV